MCGTHAAHPHHNRNAKIMDVSQIDRISFLISERERLNAELKSIISTKRASTTELSFLFGAMTAIGISRDAKLFILVYLALRGVLSVNEMLRICKTS